MVFQNNDCQVSTNLDGARNSHSMMFVDTSGTLYNETLLLYNVIEIRRKIPLHNFLLQTHSNITKAVNLVFLQEFLKKAFLTGNNFAAFFSWTFSFWLGSWTQIDWQVWKNRGTGAISKLHTLSLNHCICWPSCCDNIAYWCIRTWKKQKKKQKKTSDYTSQAYGDWLDRLHGACLEAAKKKGTWVLQCYHYVYRYNELV